ncbi:MAG: DUF3276 family protein [Bacteroidetes bacterium]|nr:DUF3276 family protein [Bacteroidota bacterium]
MEELENHDRDHSEIHSVSVRAGKRTYFFDVKATISEEYYLTITESKRKFSNEQGKFFYEKHKIFLYKEDFEKFANGLKEAIAYIEANQKGGITERRPHIPKSRESSSVTFEDLGAEAVPPPDED